MLSKAEFAALVREMPDASDDEILAAAKQREQVQQSPDDGTSMLGKLWEKANQPITTLPSRLASAVADRMDDPARLDELTRRLPEPLKKAVAFMQGGQAGVVKGIGDVASSLSSPVNLALTALGFGGEAAGARGMLGISQGARAAEAALQAPMVAEGAKNVIQGLREGDYGKAGAGAVEAAGGAAGINGAFKHSFPVQKVAEAYAEEAGIPKAQVAPHEPVKVNPEEAKAIADAYQAMPHNPQAPEVAASYKKLAQEIENQFGFITQKAGVKMEPWTQAGQPYANSAEMMADIKNNNRLFYFPTEGGFGENAAPSDHPMLQMSDKFGVPINDLFRAVHDYFGHAKQGFQFGPAGEENAWLSHKGTLSPEAVPALTTETRGQNSWVNSGAHLRDAQGNLPKKGEPGFIPPQDRPFAEQKAGLLPAEFLQRRPSDVSPQSAPNIAAALETESAPGRAAASTSAPTTEAPSVEKSQGPLPSQPVYPLAKASSIVADLTRRNDGASFNLYKGDLLGTPHYAVSVYPERGEVIPGQATPQDIAQFVQKNADLLQDPKNSIGTWFNKADGKTYLDISVTTPDIKEAATLGKAKGQLAIFDLGNKEEISLQPHPASEFTPVGEEPQYQPPTFKEPKVGYSRIAAQGGRDIERVRLEQAAKGLGGGAATAMAIAAPAVSAALPDDSNDPVVKYGKIGLDILGAAGLIGAAVRGRQVKELTPVQHAANQGAAALWLGGKKAFTQALGENATPTMLAASQKILDRHLDTTLNELPNTKKLLALNKAGMADHQWYDKTQAELQQKFGADAPLVAKFFAATSNNATVSSNAALTLKALKQYKMGEPFTGFLPDVIENLKRAAADQPLNGRKIDNFAKALSGDPDAVVADRWIMRAFGFNKGTALTDTQYDFIENAIKQLADKTGQTPRQVQAAIWFAFKNAAEEGKNRPPSPSPEQAIQHSIDLRHAEALRENRKFDKARARGLSLPF